MNIVHTVISFLKAFAVGAVLAVILFTTATIFSGCATGNKTRRIANPLTQSSGTMFNVTYKGKTFGVTAAHVCSKSRTGFLVYPENGVIHDLKILAKDMPLDVCILEPAPGIPAFAVAAPDKDPKTIEIYGFPGFSGSEIRSSGVLSGIDVAPSQVLREDNGECPNKTFELSFGDDGESVCFGPVLRAETNARVYRGSSGGPVLDEEGKVCGVVTAIGLPTGQPTYFAPTPLLTYLLDQLVGT